MNEEIAALRPPLEAELQHQVARLDAPATKKFQEMVAYHMGWVGEGAGPEAAGKRIRPLLLLLVVKACGADWRKALPAAAAVELIHNFSLVHDDIQDNSDLRRGRPTLWKKLGAAMAINVGDAIYSLANQALTDCSAHYPAETIVKATSVLQAACLDLTRGQYLDMIYQGRNDLSVEDYWPMVEGKTAALLSACTEIGALLGGAQAECINQYHAFGRDLGLAFQVQDDILGIWGNATVTGKSAASDLVEGKNSLPVLYALGQKGPFARRWSASPITASEVSEVAQMLKREGAYDYSMQQAQRLTNQALQALRSAEPNGEAGAALMELANKLLRRDS